MSLDLLQELAFSLHGYGIQMGVTQSQEKLEVRLTYENVRLTREFGPEAYGQAALWAIEQTDGKVKHMSEKYERSTVQPNTSTGR